MRGEYLPSPAPSAPHHLTHPSGLVSSSLFFRFHSRPLAAKPRPRLVDHASIDQYISNQLTAGHSLFPILYHNNQLDQRPVARSFPGLNLRTSYDQPSDSTEVHAIFYQLSLLPPPTLYRTSIYSCSCSSPRKFPCRILGQLCDTTCISVTTTVDVRHDNRIHDDTLLLVHVSALTHRSTRQARNSWEIDSSTPFPSWRLYLSTSVPPSAP